jgi:hypothetical protein
MKDILAIKSSTSPAHQVEKNTVLQYLSIGELANL